MRMFYLHAHLFFCDSFAIKLLEDVVFFVADAINSGQPVLDVTMTKANRERQKLMREQNILKQVRNISHITSLLDPMSKWILHIY